MKNSQKLISNKLILLFPLLFAFLIRILTLFSAYSNGKITFIGFDSFYHIRRIVYTVHHFPNTITFDPYLNYPFGFEIGWPPLYDQLIAGLALIVGNGNPSINTIEIVSAIFPALIGALTILPLYYLASTVFEKRTALISALILSLIPAHLAISEVGFTDHHVAEVFLSTTAYALFAVSLKYGHEVNLSVSNIKNRDIKLILKPIVLAVAAGCILTIAVFTWLGSPIFLGIIGIYAFVQLTIDVKNERLSEYVLISVIATYMTIFLLVLPVIGRLLRPDLNMSGMFISWFHVLFILSLLIMSLLGGIIANIFIKKEIHWKYYVASVLAISMTGAVLINIALPNFYHNVVAGIHYLIGSSGFLETITEARPILFDETFTTSHVWSSFTIFSLTAVMGLFAFVTDMHKKNYSSEMLFFCTWTAIILILTLYQRRFAYMLAINFAILSGYFTNTLYNIWKNEQEQNKKRKTKKEASKTPLWETITNITIISIFMIIISFFFFAPIVDTVSNPGIPSADWQESLNWLESNSLETSFYLEMNNSPEYGVLSWWDYGNWILYMAKRPVVANNFQTGVEDSARFFITSNRSESLSILEKRNVKYVITDNLMTTGKFKSIFDISGESSYKGKEIEEFIQGEDFLKTTLFKLHLFDGSGIGYLRLIHESEWGGLNEGVYNFYQNYTYNKNVKVFEYVPGAIVEGFANPEQKVYARTNVTLSNGRVFEYQNEATANESGWYELKLPYSTIDTPYNSTVENYRITVDVNSSLVKEVHVTEKDVMSGNRLRTDLS
ncbi:oligosaccharyl transferase, archaeosortase A system-associated [Methanolobus sediminis]|uniref:dolichyl-phosphooligosaccharide-protein glycotransferase n=1 Tax=Methanolobus sediminis TaxID=3072978 RepID=A0AA51UJR8_9EURY|nr:oligosaccharyl transferase, archaeosortase A system-associated [Methanolobus sediminis]WMW24378.1 oligosaccharyl transferase, archaeosortase A system-associated [Methanolobus sediminis]